MDKIPENKEILTVDIKTFDGSKDYKQKEFNDHRTIQRTGRIRIFQIALVASRLGQFCENLENTREINP